MVVSGNTLIVYGQDFKVITCGYTEPSDGVGPISNSLNSLSISSHLKPSDSISIIDPIWCRVSPAESDGGSSEARNA